MSEVHEHRASTRGGIIRLHIEDGNRQAVPRAAGESIFFLLLWLGWLFRE